MRSRDFLFSISFIPLSVLACLVFAWPAHGHNARKCKSDIESIIRSIDAAKGPNEPGDLAEDLAHYLEENPRCGDSAEIVDEIGALLNNEDDAVRWGAAASLASVGPPARRAVPAL